MKHARANRKRRKFFQQQIQRMNATSKPAVSVRPVAKSRANATSFPIEVSGPVASPRQKSTTKVATVRTANQTQRLRQPVHDFFQMLLGSWFINFRLSFQPMPRNPPVVL